MDNDLKFCGVALDERGELQSVYYRECPGGVKELLYRDFCGGNSVCGFKTLNLQEEEKYVLDKGKGTFVDSSIFTHFKEMLLTQARGRCILILSIEEGFLLVEDLFPMKAVIQPKRLGERESIPYTDEVDVCSIDEEDCDYTLLDLIDM